MLITSAPQCYSSKRLIEEFELLFGHGTEQINPKNIELASWLNLESNDPILLRSTGIDYDDTDLLLLDNLSCENLKWIQSNSELRLFRDKLSQYLFFRSNNITTPETLFFKGELPFDSLYALDEVPYIVKTRRGMKGLGVTYVDSKRSLISLLKTLWSMGDQQFIVQPYIDGFEYRFFVVDAKIHSVLKKEKHSVTGNFRTDTTTTLDADAVIPNEVTQLLHKISSHYFAVDLISTDENNYVLEVNLAPGFEQLEAITGDNIAKLIWNKNFN